MEKRLVEEQNVEAKVQVRKLLCQFEQEIMPHRRAWREMTEFQIILVMCDRTHL